MPDHITCLTIFEESAAVLGRCLCAEGCSPLLCLALTAACAAAIMLMPKPLNLAHYCAQQHSQLQCAATTNKLEVHD